MILDYEDDEVLIDHLVAGKLANNVYFVTDKVESVSLMIDAATDGARLVDTCKQRNVTQILQTHNHWDHIGAIADVRAAGYPVSISAADSHAVDGFDSTLADGDVIELGRLRIDVLLTPGHTPGSTCFAVQGRPVLFTGDTLFPGGPGATHFPGGDFEMMVASLQRLFEFSDETSVLPGHGNSTTIGTERPSLASWIAR